MHNRGVLKIKSFFFEKLNEILVAAQLIKEKSTDVVGMGEVSQ